MVAPFPYAASTIRGPSGSLVRGYRDQNTTMANMLEIQQGHLRKPGTGAKNWAEPMQRNSQLQPQGRSDSGEVRGRKSCVQSQRISTKVRIMGWSPASFHGGRTGVCSSSGGPLDSPHLTGFRWKSCKAASGDQ